ncbi:ribbon-helix-helix domain-containing protein [Parashewanella tropica]|uniref:ribbon-helix-helix domain-containing protein n=1 Tax=Parashewanella tropica TaxID=2547970 RepID=UPI001059BCF0|nr:ribbon-helix-helix domain-containing protein [Parashewanella tropica]
MCQLFIDAEPSLWQPRTRSLRIEGVVTSIRLEQFFWQVLTEIAQRDNMSDSSLISKLYLESIDAGHDLGNFTSFLRVCCARYLSLAADKQISRDQSPLSKISNVTQILSLEKQLYLTKEPVNSSKH